ncbi:hypothetical protein GCM10022254_16420 [Actinomadura meridiana]|uniref:Peptidase inhibitor family I36 n=1 Tax=Actinomadura meridiana TaxID=559626 RepID=A0ABP8BVP9_9ACTN
MRTSHVTGKVAVVAGATAGVALFAAPAQATTGVRADVQWKVDQVIAEHPGARQTAPGTVTFADGVVLTIPTASTAGVCATGAYCFYQDTNYRGRKLTFRDCANNGLWQYLTDYGFGNKTSSWQNFTKHTVVVYDQNATPPAPLWNETPGGESVNVGGEDNKADGFQTYCG